jgi:hypothetical protein
MNSPKKLLARLLILLVLGGVNVGFATIDVRARSTECPPGGGSGCWGNCDDWTHTCVTCTLPLCTCDEYTPC